MLLVRIFKIVLISILQYKKTHYRSAEFIIMIIIFHGCGQVHVPISEVILYGRLQVRTLSVSVVQSRGTEDLGGRFSEVNFILNAC